MILADIDSWRDGAFPGLILEVPGWMLPMRTSTRVLLFLVLLTTVLAAGSLPSRWRAPLALTWRDSPPAAQTPEDVFAATIHQRSKAKHGIIQRLLAGEMGLLEAAAWFAYVNETPADYPDHHWHSLPGCCDGEKLCRLVISWAASDARGTLPARQRKARLRQLEEDLEKSRAADGTVTLPCVLAPGS
jgi:hypothetical protein